MATRREYADVAENTPSLATGECVQIQTEPRKIFVAESQVSFLNPIKLFLNKFLFFE